MKKIVSGCLMVVTVLTYLMIISFYQVKDYDQIVRMGQTKSSYQIYLKDSQITPSDQLAFFKNLAKQDGVSIILTTNSLNNVVEKSVIVNPHSFPKTSFRLKQIDLADKKSFYASYNTKKLTQKGTIPVFAKNNKVILQSMDRYFQKKQIVDGVYTIIPGKSSKKAVLKKLTRFYGVSRAQLLKPTIGNKFEYFTKNILILGFLLVLTILVFLLVNTYYPITQSSTIGIKKLNGWNNRDILFDMIKFGILTILIVATGLDLISFVLFSYQPQGFLLCCILSQIIILCLYTLVNIFTYIIIKHLSIADMLKGSFHFGFGIKLAFILKVMMTITSTVLLVNVSNAITSVRSDYQLQQDWSKEGKLLTVNSVSSFFQTNEKQAEKIMSNWFKAIAKNKGVYYVDSEISTAKAILPEKATIHNPTAKYAMMTVNRNFINAKLPRVKKYLDSTSHIFLVPIKYRRADSQIRYLLQCYRYNDLASKQQEKLKPEQVKIKIKYYDEKISPITYNVRLKKRFVNPIIEVMEESRITDGQSLFLSNTDKNSPIKIENNQQTKRVLEKSVQNAQVKQLGLKFVTVSEILTTSLDSSYRGLQALLIGLIAIFIINLFTTTFLMLYIISSKQKKLAVERLLGYRKVDRYQIEILLISCLGISEILVLVYLKATIISLLLAALLVLIDLLVFDLVVRIIETRDLSFLLKGGLA